MLEHQKVQKRTQKIQNLQDNRKLWRKKMLQGKKRCGSYELVSSRKRSVSFFCRTKSTRTRCQMQKWQQNFRDCRQEKKEEAAMLRRWAIAAWKHYGSKLLPYVLQWVQTSDALANAVFQRFKESGAVQ